MSEGRLGGNIYVFKMMDGEPYEIDQPIGFSCGPSTITLESKAYTASDEAMSNVAHLHQSITAPNKQIKIYDLSTGTEATSVSCFNTFNTKWFCQITRGNAYQAIVSLGDSLYDGFEMSVDSCVVVDQKGRKQEVLKNNQIADGLEGHIAPIDQLVIFPEFDYTFAMIGFDFYGFGRPGAETCKLHYNEIKASYFQSN